MAKHTLMVGGPGPLGPPLNPALSWATIWHWDSAR